MHTDVLVHGSVASKIRRFTMNSYDYVIKWQHFPRYWPFVRGIHRSPVNSPHNGQWRGALMFFSICVWINGWVYNREAGDLRRYRAHYDVTVMVQWDMPVAGAVVETSAIGYRQGRHVALTHLRPKQNGHLFADDMFKCIFLNENVWPSIEISLKCA